MWSTPSLARPKPYNCYLSTSYLNKGRFYSGAYKIPGTASSSHSVSTSLIQCSTYLIYSLLPKLESSHSWWSIYFSSHSTSDTSEARTCLPFLIAFSNFSFIKPALINSSISFTSSPFLILLFLSTSSYNFINYYALIWPPINWSNFFLSILEIVMPPSVFFKVWGFKMPCGPN